MTRMVEAEPIQYEVDGHVARIWLNRPHKRNSVSQQLLQELDEARIRAENDPEVRVIVIRGREGTFCSGFDLDELQGDFIGSIATEDAKIGDFHIRRALFGGAGPIYRVPRILGERKAKELMLTGKLLSGREAYEWGLVNACAPAEELDACVDDFVANLVDKSPFQTARR